MIVVSQGLDGLALQHYKPLYNIIQSSFPNGDAAEIIGSMQNMVQYFYFKKNKPIAIVSFRKRGRLYSQINKNFSNVLYNVATAPNYRKKGYMKKLLRFIIQHQFGDYKRRCLHLEVLTNNTPASSLYKKLGFEPQNHNGGMITHMRLCR